ncbi:hypothetical protein [Streptomyces rimosus]|uniref:hypothetical protein n=1 Tax=Streptomyces rimosus TaxID=1927 RepID=UPI00131AF90F|nr:hypothetical protein [Streptomyces rimosus]
MHEPMVTADLGAGFVALRGRVNGKFVCLVTPEVMDDEEKRKAVRGLIERQGGDCTSCRGCIIGINE